MVQKQVLLKRVFTFTGLKLLYTKETIYYTKGQKCIASANTKTSSPFYGMIAKTKVPYSLKCILQYSH